MKNLVRLILLILATFRITELITKDEGPYEIFTKLRQKAGQNANRSVHHKTFADAIHCPYCTGVYVSFFVFLLPKIFLWPIAVAGGQSLLESITKKD